MDRPLNRLLGFACALGIVGLWSSAASASGLAAATATATAADAARGERIYRQGQLAPGVPVRAVRDGVASQGAGVACVNCHRRSGLGSYEGTVLVPPIIGPYLFRDGEVNSRDLDLPHIAGYAPRPVAYTEQSLARVLRSGATPDGHMLNVLMPRYDLDDGAMADLTLYLRTLSSGPFPGVNGTQIELATLVTPDADPIERDAMLGVLDRFVTLRNAAVAARVQSGSTAAAAQYRAARLWHLNIWTLTGERATWDAQLQRLQDASPVFAVISGVGRLGWEPVDRFCERRHVPCLFPNIDLPPAAVGGNYALYFSRGLRLEGDLLLRRLNPGPGSRARPRLIQVYRSGDIGSGAAAALTAAARREFRVLNKALPPEAGVSSALSGVLPSDVLILWLRPADLRDLGATLPTPRVFISGSMADPAPESVPAAWRGAARLLYPFDPPQSRALRENYPHAWLRQHGLALVNDRVQSNTYLACGILADAIDGMLDAFVPDLLLERIQGMVSSRMNTGYFPRLGLAAGQQFASKGGLIVRFTAADAAQMTNDGEWLAP